MMEGRPQQYQELPLMMEGRPQQYQELPLMMEGRPQQYQELALMMEGHPHQTSHSEAASSSGVGRRTTPLGAQLTTENCPMCNTKFPSWYEQVDADRHIAECLQAVNSTKNCHS
jgi:hypothetical protein